MDASYWEALSSKYREEYCEKTGKNIADVSLRFALTDGSRFICTTTDPYLEGLALHSDLGKSPDRFIAVVHPAHIVSFDLAEGLKLGRVRESGGY